MSKFSTKGTSVSEGKKYLQPGISIVAISEITGAAPEGKSPYLEFNFKSKENETGNVRLYMSDAASPKSKEKLVHMATAIIGRDGIDAIEADTIESYGKKLTSAMKDKAFRMKFTGKQTKGNDGNIYTNISIGLPTFAENLSITETKLKFNPNNSYDLEKIVTETDNTIDEFTSNTDTNDIF